MYHFIPNRQGQVNPTFVGEKGKQNNFEISIPRLVTVQCTLVNQHTDLSDIFPKLSQHQFSNHPEKIDSSSPIITENHTPNRPAFIAKEVPLVQSNRIAFIAKEVPQVQNNRPAFIANEVPPPVQIKLIKHGVPNVEKISSKSSSNHVINNPAKFGQSSSKNTADLDENRNVTNGQLLVGKLRLNIPEPLSISAPKSPKSPRTPNSPRIVKNAAPFPIKKINTNKITSPLNKTQPTSSSHTTVISRSNGERT